MSNMNNRNGYGKVGHGADNGEMEVLLNSSNTQQITRNNQMTAINIENIDILPGTSQQHMQRQQHFQHMRRDVDSTRINMEANAANLQQNANGGHNPNADARQRVPNLFTIIREARHQLNRSQSLRDRRPSANGENISVTTHSRTWRENLYEVLSSPVASQAHTNVLRAIFTPTSANVRHEGLHTNVLLSGDQFHISFNTQNTSQTDGDLQSSLRNQRNNGLESQSTSALRLSRQNSRLTDNRSLNENSTSQPQTPAADNTDTVGRPTQRQISEAGSTADSSDEMIEDVDANAVGEIMVKILTAFLRYLPFIFIIFVKFIHDHLLSILSILVLQGVFYHINKSLKEEVAKLNQKSFRNLVFDLIMVVVLVTYRFSWFNATPDPFGLLVNPPDATSITLDFSTIQKEEPLKEIYPKLQMDTLTNAEHNIFDVPPSATTNTLNSTISVTTSISLGKLLYYVAVNDLILKLLTTLIKIVVTMFPTKMIRHKARARLYAVIEHISQFYRALVPIRQWLRFLFGAYTGLEVISGLLFSSFYMGAKFFELFERGRKLKEAIVNIVRNMDYDREPTKDELDAAGTVCPICHDSYSSPIMLECGHIFCDECVSTWFRREQTCPMCRAKISEDLTWQDGATTYFYQLC